MTSPSLITRVLPFRSLRARLLTLVLGMVVVPGVLFAVISFLTARSALEQAVGTQLAEVAHDAADELENLLALEAENVRMWSTQDVVRNLQSEDGKNRLTRFLSTIQQGNVAYLGITVRDATGRLIRHAPAVVGDEAGYATADPSVPFEIQHQKDGKWVALFSAPIDDPSSAGARLGSITLAMNWSATEKILDRLRRNLLGLGADVDMAYLDRHGRVRTTAGYFGHDVQLGKGLPSPAWVFFNRDLPKIADEGWLYEEKVGAVIGYARLAGVSQNWVALAIQPAHNAFAPIRRMLSAWVVILGAIVAIASFLAWRSADRIVDPLRRLTMVTQEIARSNKFISTGLVSEDEIGQFAKSFDLMSARLEEARQDLLTTTRLASVGEMAAGIAHEVRTPLSVLRASAQVLQRDSAGANAAASELIRGMIEEVDRLDRVISELLQLARPQAPCAQPTALGALLHRATDFARIGASEKGVDLSLVAPAEEQMVQCDPDQIYQVALNLLLNAIQFTPREGRVLVQVFLDDEGHPGFSVEDSGPGIPQADRERIFTPFYTTRGEGTGLGLAFVQRIVNAHHGRVTADSSHLGGARFRIWLPRSNRAHV